MVTQVCEKDLNRYLFTQEQLREARETSGNKQTIGNLT